MLADGGSLRQECACRGVELATLLLQAFQHRITWATHPPDLPTRFAELRARLVSAVGGFFKLFIHFNLAFFVLFCFSAWRINRPEAGLDLAIRFLDKDLIVQIADQLDKQAGDGKQHNNLMTAVSRCRDSQLADHALQWHYSRGEKARLQSLLVALQERESATPPPPDDSSERQMKRPLVPSPSTAAKRHKQVAGSCVSRFLERREARDFAWLHQLINRDFKATSGGLLAAGMSETNALGRRRTLLSLAKLAGIAGDYRGSNKLEQEVSESEGLVEKSLEVIRYQEAWMHQSAGDIDRAAVLPPAALARLYVAEVGEAEGERRADLLATFSIALRLAQLATEVEEAGEDPEDQQKRALLEEIWSQAVKVDS